MRFKRALLATALVSVLASVALPAAARADSSVPLAFPQLAGFHQILADDAAGYVFISEGTVADYGPGAGGIVVTDLSGRYVTTLDTGDDAKGLALSPDGKTLYAALAATDAVGVIDTATLTQTTTYPLATAGTAPYSLALQSGKLWVSYDVAASDLAPSHGAIGDFDLSAADPSLETQPAMDGASAEYFAWYSAPNIAADPADTGVLVAVNYGVPLVISYKVTADPVTKLSWGTGEAACGPALGSLALLPGGAQLVMCGTINLTADLGGYDGSPNQYQGKTLALSPSASSPNTGLVAVMGTTRVPGSTRYEWAAEVSQVTNGSWSWPNFFGFAGPAAGLAFGANGSRLYAVLENTAGTAFQLAVIDNPAATSSRLTLSAPATAGVGSRYTISGGLALNAGSPVAGTPVTVTRTRAGSPAVQFALTTDAHGRFALADKPATAGTYTYSARYAAYGLTAAASSATAAVRVGTLVMTVKPRLTGTPKAGKALSVTPGTWNPAATVKVQWYANGKAISRATGLTLRLTSGLRGKVISVTVKASRAGYTTAAVTLREAARIA